jgi:hypothetical protein
MRFVGLLTLAGALTPLFGGPITLQNATATFSQTVNNQNFFASSMIDGSFLGGVGEGWAIYDPTYGTLAQTAVFETQSNVGFATGVDFTFQLHQLYTVTPGHTVGRFRLSVTTDDRDTFADGLQSGGAVTANWTVLTPLTASGTLGPALTILGDESVLASGAAPGTSVYTVTGSTALSGITGIRLEVLEDPSLPTDGPGRYFTNGNFVLTEFTVDATAGAEAGAVPEPATAGLMLAAFGALACLRLRRHP